MDEISKLDRVLRLKQVREMIGLSRSTIYRSIALGTFPAPIPLGPRSVGFLESEVRAWVAANIVQRNTTTARSATQITCPAAGMKPCPVAAELEHPKRTPQEEPVVQDEE